MSTRAVVAMGKGDGSWRLYYRHCDGYPAGLGVELVQLLKEGKDEEQIAELAKLDFETYMPERFVEEAANTIFPGFQADLEWIYFISFSPPAFRFDIFRTSNPYFEENFTFHVWGAYLPYLPQDWREQLQYVELAAMTTLKALRAFNRAKGRR